MHRAAETRPRKPWNLLITLKKTARAPQKKTRPTASRKPTSAGILKLIESVGGARQQYVAKTLLFEQGQPVGPVYYIVRGKIQITVLSKQGKEGAIAIFSDGDFVGEASLMPQPLYLDSALAVTDCDVIQIHNYTLRLALAQNKPFAEYFTNFLLQRTLDVQADLIDHLFNSSEKRLARALLLLANFGQAGKLEPIANITHELLAQRIGTTRARISFFMNKFRRLGLIEYNGEIKVHSGLLNVVLNESPLGQRPKTVPEGKTRVK